MIQVEGPKVDREDREDGWAEAGGGSGVRRGGGAETPAPRRILSPECKYA